MGFYSWKTVSMGVSISNKYSERGALPVGLLIPKEFGGGAIIETDYEGYGVFGGRDVFAWLGCNGSTHRGVNNGYSCF